MIKVMVYRPTIFEVEAKNFDEAKEVIVNKLVNDRQMRPSDPIYFGEITDGVTVGDKEDKNGEKIK